MQRPNAMNNDKDCRVGQLTRVGQTYSPIFSSCTVVDVQDMWMISYHYHRFRTFSYTKSVLRGPSPKTLSVNFCALRPSKSHNDDINGTYELHVDVWPQPSMCQDDNDDHCDDFEVADDVLIISAPTSQAPARWTRTALWSTTTPPATVSPSPCAPSAFSVSSITFFLLHTKLWCFNSS